MIEIDLMVLVPSMVHSLRMSVSDLFPMQCVLEWDLVAIQRRT